MLDSSTSPGHNNPAMKRRYSSSRLITAMHGRRFSAPHLSEKRYSFPDENRRYSGRYSVSIEPEVLVHLAEKPPLSGCQLFWRRGLALLLCGAVLGIGVLVRIFIQMPYTMCLAAFPNGTYPVLNDTLPHCNYNITQTNSTQMGEYLLLQS